METEFRQDQIERLVAFERKFGKEGLTFDDVLLVPAESHVLPNDVSTVTRLTPTIALNIPLVSAAMDTVTEARLAIALAREGGIGIVHRNLSIEDQVAEVDKVKRSESGMIVEPVTLAPANTVAEALELMERYRISGVPITDDDGVLVGILTNRDLRFETDTAQPVSALMTARNLVTAPVGTTLEEAEAILHRNKIEKLPVVDARRPPQGAHHRQGHLEEASSTRTRRRTSRAVCASVRRSAWVPTRSSAHPRSSPPRSTCWSSTPRTATPTAFSTSSGGSVGAHDVQLIAGNISSAEGALALADAGADAVKVGQGPGSICTTRIVAGVGVPQITAVYDAAQALDGQGIPVIADGGVRNSGDIAKAIAAGADVVMLGSMLAGTDEAPGRGHRRAGRALQGVPRHGLARRHEGAVVLEGPLFPGRRRGRRQARPGGDRGPRAVQGPARADRPPGRRRPPPVDGLLRRGDDRGDEGDRRASRGSRRQACRRAIRTA